MRDCVTHHHACDCREAEMDRLQEQVATLEYDQRLLRRLLRKKKDRIATLTAFVQTIVEASDFDVVIDFQSEARALLDEDVAPE